MRVIGLAGWSGSGKTTLVTKVIPVLVKRGGRRGRPIGKVRLKALASALMTDVTPS
jgi:molybdopterin-guanine dinucleotide biosynthesis protein